MAETHVVRSTLTPDVEQTIGHDEYELWLELGIVYDGTPPVEPVDPFDARVAERLDDEDSQTRAKVDELVNDSIVAFQDPALAAIVADENSETSAELRAAFVASDQLVLSPTAPTAPAPGTVWINTTV